MRSSLVTRGTYNIMTYDIMTFRPSDDDFIAIELEAFGNYFDGAIEV